MKNKNFEIFASAKEKAMNRRNTERSAWRKGVAVYAAEILEGVMEHTNLPDIPPLTVNNLDDCLTEIKRMALNGAENWRQYSEGGCSLVWNTDIAFRLCAPWELNKTNGGLKSPNSRESWLDVQTRALRQAWNLARQSIIDATYEAERQVLKRRDYGATYKGHRLQAFGIDAWGHDTGLALYQFPIDKKTILTCLWSNGRKASQFTSHRLRRTKNGRAYIMAAGKRLHLDTVYSLKICA